MDISLYIIVVYAIDSSEDSYYHLLVCELRYFVCVYIYDVSNPNIIKLLFKGCFSCLYPLLLGLPITLSLGVLQQYY